MRPSPNARRGTGRCGCRPQRRSGRLRWGCSGSAGIMERPPRLPSRHTARRARGSERAGDVQGATDFRRQLPAGLHRGTAGDTGPQLIVVTPFARISHLGTLFQAVVGATAMAVSARRGRVRVRESGSRMQTLTEGEGVEMLRGRTVQRMTVAPGSGKLGPAGNASARFPDRWAAAVGVSRLVCARDGVEAGVRGGGSRDGHSAHHALGEHCGPKAGLRPNQALAAVMATTRFEHDTYVPGELRIRMRGRADRAREPDRRFQLRRARNLAAVQAVAGAVRRGCGNRNEPRRWSPRSLARMAAHQNSADSSANTSRPKGSYTPASRLPLINSGLELNPMIGGCLPRRLFTPRCRCRCGVKS